ncbi:MAG: penicillin-binding transpeptidase domain-containing protein [bacterium]
MFKKSYFKNLNNIKTLADIKKFKTKDKKESGRIRLFVMFVVICGLFGVLLSKLYTLQIIQGEYLTNQVLGTISKPINLDAPRGSIYDKFGRPLAVNESSFTVNIDPSISVDNLDQVILNTMNILERNNETIVDEFPISKEEPFVFLFNNSPSLERTWKNDMNLGKNSLGLDLEDITPDIAFELLRQNFGIDPELPNEDARKILLVRTELYKTRYSQFLPLTLAYDITEKTIADIEENSQDFLNIYIDVEAKRNYPAGESFSHILGYIRGISTDELTSLKESGFDNYTANDLIGKDGIEKAFESTLKGTDGTSYYEVDNLGRKISESTDLSEPSISGNDVFLTLDANLNEVVYDAIEVTLKDTIINRLSGRNYAGPNYTTKDIYISMVKANTLNMKQILNSDSVESHVYSQSIRNYILYAYEKEKEKENEAKNEDEDDIDILVELISDTSIATTILANGIADDIVSLTNVIFALVEQGVITADVEYREQIMSGNISSSTVLIDKLNSLEITPQMTGMLQAPASASVIVTDIETGAVLSSVSYPAYDNNEFVNTFNNEYYTQLNTDPTSPMLNRTFTEPRAPGSTFKMIVALAALETNLITTSTTIYDKDVFTDAGYPYAQCWIHGSHGYVDVCTSLEVSCNYFYYDVSYRMGIETMNYYMKMFGLDERSGVEIYELYDAVALQNYPSRISSPEYKEYIVSARNPDAPIYDIRWSPGDTIRTAIGQAYNNYTAANLVKYTATLANGGYNYSLHFLDKITSSEGNILEKYTPILESKLDLQPENLQAIHDGMYAVTSGSSGTLRNAFRDFPVKVAAKSGTAQESSLYNNHNVFTGFAPYDDPQIAITVFIPYGDDSYSPAPKITRIILEEYLSLNREPENFYTNVLTS